MTSTEKETTALQDRIDAILKSKVVKNNFANIETFDTIDPVIEGFEENTDDTSNELINNAVMEAEAYGSDVKKSFQTKANKWKRAFQFVTDLKPKDMKPTFEGIKPKAKGWGKIFKAIFYMYPILIDLIVDEVVSAVPKTMEGNISGESFRKRKRHDAAIMVNTAYEFGYTILAIYFSHMIYARLYGSKRLHKVEEFLKSGIPPVDFLLYRIVFLYLTLLPTFVYHFLYDFLKNVIWGVGLDKYPTLTFICIFFVCYLITYLCLDKMGKMFLQIFDYKASAFTYVMIVLAWFVRLFSMPFDAFKQKQAEAQGQLMGEMSKGMGGIPGMEDMSGLANGMPGMGSMSGAMPEMSSGLPGIMSEFEILVNTRGLYIFILLIHLAISLLMAPLCQLVGVAYIAYAFVGTPYDWAAVISGLFSKTAQSFITEVQIDCHKSVFSNKEEIVGGLDNFAYLYGYRYWIFFIMMLFFFFKTIQSAVEMKITALRTAVSTMNAYITATMAVIYSAHVYFEKDLDAGDEFLRNPAVKKSVPGQLSSVVPGLSAAVSGDLSKALPVGVSQALPVDLSKALPGLSEALPGLSEALPGLSEALPGLSEALPVDLSGLSNVAGSVPDLASMGAAAGLGAGLLPVASSDSLSGLAAGMTTMAALKKDKV